MTISTHVLDTVRGVGARAVPVRLERVTGEPDENTPDESHTATTGDDGRVADLLNGAPLVAGRYRLVLDSAAYARSMGEETFFPEVVVVFEVSDVQRHHHVPVLLSPFAYTTYRGT